ncbi:hypothetical protein [uncultured Erythrobacter sp.]|uniref:hypothetical protein n=1 Tax=uncultured Erythrobacter sp. TaxID=263913 RepID=UPI002619B2F8|nr:hypothetical protein [uncultured Erythrobacter sp.]
MALAIEVASLLLIGALGFGLRALARTMLPDRKVTRFVIVAGLPWIAIASYFLYWFCGEDFTDPLVWAASGFLMIAVFLNALPYWAGYLLEWVWRVLIRKRQASF